MSFRVGNDIVIDEVNLTTSDIVSEILDCTNIYGLSAQAISTGTISGSVVLEVSNNKEDWFELSGFSITVLNTTNTGDEKSDLFFKWARLKYSATSGSTNTLKVFATIKGI